jgi:hypothetical protein
MSREARLVLRACIAAFAAVAATIAALLFEVG